MLKTDSTTTRLTLLNKALREAETRLEEAKARSAKAKTAARLAKARQKLARDHVRLAKRKARECKQEYRDSEKLLERVLSQFQKAHKAIQAVTQTTAKEALKSKGKAQGQKKAAKGPLSTLHLEPRRKSLAWQSAAKKARSTKKRDEFPVTSLG